MDNEVSAVVAQVWTLLGALAGTLTLLALTLWLGARVAEQGRALWRAVRGHVPQVLAAVDEPGDPVNAALGRWTGVPPQVWAAFWPAFVRALADGLNQTLEGEAASSGEKQS